MCRLRCAGPGRKRVRVPRHRRTRRDGATGDIIIGANRSVTARFTGLEGNGGGAEGNVEGSVEVRCG